MLPSGRKCKPEGRKFSPRIRNYALVWALCEPWGGRVKGSSCVKPFEAVPEHKLAEESLD